MRRTRSDSSEYINEADLSPQRLSVTEPILIQAPQKKTIPSAIAIEISQASSESSTTVRLSQNSQSTESTIAQSNENPTPKLENTSKPSAQQSLLDVQESVISNPSIQESQLTVRQSFSFIKVKSVQDEKILFEHQPSC